MSPLDLSLRFLQTQPDARLAALARAGHERAFEALVRRYRKQLLGYSRRIGSPSANAEDALQQTFLQAWIALRAGREVRDVRAWLYRIAHNVVISNVRQQGGNATQLDDRLPARGVADEAEQRIAVREALAGLASLPGLQRDVMVGTAVDGLSHAEIARELGLTSGAVRGLIYRARSSLRVAAALFVPGPAVQWAARHGAAQAPSGRLYEAIAGGGGSAGAGVLGLILKGGVITATAGVLATAAGVVSRHAVRHHRARPVVRVLAIGAGHTGRMSAAEPRNTPAATVIEAASISLPHTSPGPASAAHRSPAEPAPRLAPIPPAWHAKRTQTAPVRSTPSPRRGAEGEHHRSDGSPSDGGDHRTATQSGSGSDDGAGADASAGAGGGNVTSGGGDGSGGQLTTPTYQQAQDGSDGGSHDGYSQPGTYDQPSGTNSTQTSTTGTRTSTTGTSQPTTSDG